MLPRDRLVSTEAELAASSIQNDENSSVKSLTRTPEVVRSLSQRSL